MKQLWLVFSGVFILALLWWPLLLVGLGVGGVAQWWLPIARDRRRQRQRSEALADVVDLVIIAISSGETITGAIRLASVDGPPSVRSGFTGALDHLAAGGTVPGALQRAGDQLGSDYRSLTTALAQADREGSPVGALLIRLADEAANARRHRQETAARRLPVQMLLPLVFCSLPAVVLGAVIPLIIVSLRRL